jgi:hypothetical protein
MILLSSLLLLVASATVVACGVTAIALINYVVVGFAVCWRPFCSLLLLSFLVLLAFPRFLSNLLLLAVLVASIPVDPGVPLDTEDVNVAYDAFWSMLNELFQLNFPLRNV